MCYRLVSMQHRLLILLPSPPRRWDYRCAPSVPGLCGAEDGTQGFLHPGQDLYRMNCIPPPALVCLFKISTQTLKMSSDSAPPLPTISSHHWYIIIASNVGRELVGLLLDPFGQSPSSEPGSPILGSPFGTLLPLLRLSKPGSLHPLLLSTSSIDSACLLVPTLFLYFLMFPSKKYSHRAAASLVQPPLAFALSFLENSIVSPVVGTLPPLPLKSSIFNLHCPLGLLQTLRVPQ